MKQQKDKTYQAMLDAVRMTFENMAFLEVTEQSPEVLLEMPLESVWVSILIHDPIQLELRLVLAQSLLSEMTADMFSIELEEIAETQRLDIVAELLNTLAGLFMTNLLPDDQTYQLGLPEHGEGPVPGIEEGSLVWRLQIEGTPLLVVASGGIGG
jgi:CheY-specific phosphatase CheX